MGIKYQVPRGTKDILPQEVSIWQYIEDTCRRIFFQYGYGEIRTPIFESTELFARSIGQSTDIVSKEMYTFLDRKDRRFALRPEETAPVVRACLQNNLLQKDQIVKLYYLGPMFRYERPQAGRQRQFHQAGVEVFGSPSAATDVEVIALGVHLFEELGIKNLEVDINNVGCPKCRQKWIEKFKEALKPHLPIICHDCRTRYENNPLRVLDCKNPTCQKYIQGTPAILEFLCPDCRKHFESVLEYLGLAKVKYKINNRLVRGLDYYTKTTFEIVSRELGAQNAICGGGRYDDLVKEFGGASTPATGFAVGLERLISVMQGQKVKIPEAKKLDLYIAVVGEKAQKKGFELLEQLRKQKLSVEIDYLGKSLKAQMKVADRLGVKKTLIIGEDELTKGKAILRTMVSGEQKEIALDQVVKSLC